MSKHKECKRCKHCGGDALGNWCEAPLPAWANFASKFEQNLEEVDADDCDCFTPKDNGA